MDIVEELARQMELLAMAQARELAVQVVAIVEQARLGVKNPAIFIWSKETAPDVIRELIPEDILTNCQWVAMVPLGVNDYPFLGTMTQVFQLADGKRIIVY